MEASVSLSVSLKDVEWLNEYVPADIVREIWMKSETLLTTPNALVQAPGFDGICVRHSPDDTGIQPHFVTQSGKWQTWVKTGQPSVNHTYRRNFTNEINIVVNEFGYFFFYRF